MKRTGFKEALAQIAFGWSRVSGGGSGLVRHGFDEGVHLDIVQLKIRHQEPVVLCVDFQGDGVALGDQGLGTCEPPCEPLMIPLPGDMQEVRSRLMLSRRGVRVVANGASGVSASDAMAADAAGSEEILSHRRRLEKRRVGVLIRKDPAGRFPVARYGGLVPSYSSSLLLQEWCHIPPQVHNGRGRWG